MKLQQDSPRHADIPFPSGQCGTEIDVDIPDTVCTHGHPGRKGHQRADLVSMFLLLNASGNNLPSPEAYDPGHAEEERDVKYKLVCHAVVDDEWY